jgi:hypothetical protein
MHSFRWPLVLLVCFCCLAQPATLAANERGKGSPPRVRLAVVLMFDQLRGDYLSRWNKLFGEKGFRRLCDEAAWFQNCHYPYANTLTGPGHASVHTGCSPRTHGIISNDWFDRRAGEEVYCATSSRYQPIPPKPPNPKAKKKDRAAGSPDRLLVPTLADALLEATGGKGRVVALSFKDRSAILTGGRHPTACYWLDTSTGSFVTSTYYRDRVHPWVARFNASRPADAWFGKSWLRLRSDLDYALESGPDDVPGEGRGIEQGRTFPHPMGRPPHSLRRYYESVYNSPFGNEILLALVKEAVVAEGLGKDDVPDLLCISFSCNDPIGHCWGPDSQEVLDVTLHSDLIVRDLLAFLDDKVGPGHYTVVLTADHGICPLPEVSRHRGLDAGRIDPKLLAKRAGEFLDKKFGKRREKRGGCIESTEGEAFYLNRAWMRARKLEPGRVEQELADWLKKQDGILTAYTRTQLLQGVPADDAIGEAVLRSFHPERSGDVLPILKPYYLLSPVLDPGTTHGTPHTYDTYVPLLVFGPGVRAGVRKERVTPQAVVPILAHSLGIRPPATAEAPLPRDLFEGE